jgi:hypothetical protein
VCEEPRCASPLRARAVCKLSTLTDGEIKEGVPREAKPLSWLSFSRGVGRGTVPLGGKKPAFSVLFPALYYSDTADGAYERRR